MSFEAVNRELREETQAISDLSDINKRHFKKGRCHSNQVTANQLHQSADFF